MFRTDIFTTSLPGSNLNASPPLLAQNSLPLQNQKTPNLYSLAWKRRAYKPSFSETKVVTALETPRPTPIPLQEQYLHSETTNVEASLPNPPSQKKQTMQELHLPHTAIPTFADPRWRTPQKVFEQNKGDPQEQHELSGTDNIRKRPNTFPVTFLRPKSIPSAKQFTGSIELSNKPIYPAYFRQNVKMGANDDQQKSKMVTVSPEPEGEPGSYQVPQHQRKDHSVALVPIKQSSHTPIPVQIPTPAGFSLPQRPVLNNAENFRNNMFLRNPTPRGMVWKKPTAAVPPIPTGITISAEDAAHVLELSSNRYHQPQRSYYRRRSQLSPAETSIFNRIFDNGTIKPNAHLREALGREAGMSARSVQIWFQNRRAKMKRTNLSTEHEDAALSEIASECS